MKEHAVEVVAVVDWNSAVVDVVTEPVSTTQTKTSTHETLCNLRIFKKGQFDKKMQDPK